jgi:hypothetical protein
MQADTDTQRTIKRIVVRFSVYLAKQTRKNFGKLHGHPRIITRSSRMWSLTSRSAGQLPPRFSGLIESGIVVDTTTPNSIIREAFQKCRNDNDLRVVAVLPAVRHRRSVAVSRPLFNEISILRRRNDGSPRPNREGQR